MHNNIDSVKPIHIQQVSTLPRKNLDIFSLIIAPFIYHKIFEWPSSPPVASERCGQEPVIFLSHQVQPSGHSHL